MEESVVIRFSSLEKDINRIGNAGRTDSDTLHRRVDEAKSEAEKDNEKLEKNIKDIGVKLDKVKDKINSLGVQGVVNIGVILLAIILFFLRNSIGG